MLEAKRGRRGEWEKEVVWHTFSPLLRRLPSLYIIIIIISNRKTKQKSENESSQQKCMRNDSVVVFATFKSLKESAEDDGEKTSSPFCSFLFHRQNNSEASHAPRRGAPGQRISHCLQECPPNFFDYSIYKFRFDSLPPKTLSNRQRRDRNRNRDDENGEEKWKEPCRFFLKIHCKSFHKAGKWWGNTK